MPIKNAPSYGFGSEKRGKTHTQGTPGPGAYRVPVKIIDVPKYLIPNQNEEFKYV